MTLEMYRNFIAIVEEGNILAASRKQLLAQPALSMQLRRIEAHYGAKLVERGPRHIELTEAGRILYQKACRIVALEKEAQEDIRDSLDGHSGTLSLALPSANSASFLSFLLRDFMEKWPDVRLSIHESDSQEAADCVAAGLAEVGFVKTPITEAYRFRFFPMPSTPAAAVFPAELAFRIPQTVTLSALERWPLVMPRGIRPIVESHFEANGLRTRIAGTATTRNAAIQLARLRGCAAIVPYDPEEESLPGIIIRQIADTQIMIPRQFIILKEGTLSPIARRFLSVHGLNPDIQESVP